MFTGIVQDQGTLRSLKARGGDLRIRVQAPHLPLGRVSIGDSIAVAGVCLTVVARTGRAFDADVSRETLNLTTLGQRRVGDAVNLELALRAGDAIGGHIVSGHVDGLAQLVKRNSEARSERMFFRAPAKLSRYIAAKGSVTLDGVSLTVNSVVGHVFGVNLIPHTMTVTTLGALSAGDRVNLEVDTIARYAERLLSGWKRTAVGK